MISYTSERRLTSKLSEYGLRVIPWVFIVFEMCDMLDMMSEVHIFDLFYCWVIEPSLYFDLVLALPTQPCWNR